MITKRELFELHGNLEGEKFDAILRKLAWGIFNQSLEDLAEEVIREILAEDNLHPLVITWD